MRRVAVPLLVLALLVATTAAFAVTEALKLEPSALSRPRFDRIFSPTCACPQSTARLAVRLREADTIDAVIVDADGDLVRTLASESREPAGRVVLGWNGEDDGGDVVPDGRYRLRVHLDDERRTIVIPNLVRVDTDPPTVELVEVSPRVLSPDGDNRGDRARIGLRLSERARPLVLVDRARAAAARSRARGRSELVWPGTTRRGPLATGSYVVTLRARDRAGNLSAPTAGSVVRIRYIELAGGTLRARRGGTLRFRVSTDVAGFRWAILRRSGARRGLLRGTATSESVTLGLPRRIRTGGYVLRVAARGHSDEARIVVRARR
ncbi:MAG TPA: FlgD immunoglobulin-like domain containing protein [Gaiellaceae bacterium]|nr:FlgD immunoglobulin-like domain containing protein [Gaiellaceae bacterium]